MSILGIQREFDEFEASTQQKNQEQRRRMRERYESKIGASNARTLSRCATLALLTLLVNAGSLYRGGKGTQEQPAGRGRRKRGPEMPPKTTFAEKLKEQIIDLKGAQKEGE